MNNKPTYSEKLKDPRWQKKRLQILERDQWFCCCCCDNSKTLHVHHRRYFPGKEPWEVDDKYLITLCEYCHQSETELMPDAIHDITEVLKEHFFAHEINQITEGFIHLRMPYPTEVIADVIKYWFKNPEKSREMADEYFKYLSEKQKDKEPF